MPNRPNLKNFFYLVGSGLIIQLAGTIYRIWLARQIGAEGLGIMQMIYPVYRLLSSLASFGLPLALTKWIAEYLATHEAAAIIPLKKWASKLTATLSILAGSALYLCAPYLSHHLFSDVRVEESLKIIAIAIPFSALSAIYRGYFQGFSAMYPTATSELSEQTVEISTTALGILFLANLLPFTLVSYPIIGLMLGEITCFFTLALFLPKFSPQPTSSKKITIPRQQIIIYAWPLLLNQIISSLSMGSEGIIIPHFLMKAGYSAAESTAIFGQLTGMAEPVAYFPLILLAPLGAVLSPQISAAFKTNSFKTIKEKVALFYIAATLICLSSFLIILVFAEPIAQTLYHDLSPVGLIRLLSIGLPFTGFAILNLNILIAVGASKKLLLLSLWVTLLKVGCLIVFTPLLGVFGATWAFNITQIFMALVSWREVKRHLPELFS